MRQIILRAGQRRQVQHAIHADLQYRAAASRRIRETQRTGCLSDARDCVATPVMKLSRPTTEWPSPISRSQRCEPMNPAAPDMMNRKLCSKSSIVTNRAKLYRGKPGRPAAPALHSQFMVQLSWPETALFLVLLAASRPDSGCDSAKSGISFSGRRRIPISASSRWGGAFAISSGK